MRAILLFCCCCCCCCVVVVATTTTTTAVTAAGPPKQLQRATLVLRHENARDAVGWLRVNLAIQGDDRGLVPEVLEVAWCAAVNANEPHKVHINRKTGRCEGANLLHKTLYTTAAAAAAAKRGVVNELWDGNVVRFDAARMALFVNPEAIGGDGGDAEIARDTAIMVRTRFAHSNRPDASYHDVVNVLHLSVATVTEDAAPIWPLQNTVPMKTEAPGDEKLPWYISMLMTLGCFGCMLIVAAVLLINKDQTGSIGGIRHVSGLANWAARLGLLKKNHRADSPRNYRHGNGYEFHNLPAAPSEEEVAAAAELRKKDAALIRRLGTGANPAFDFGLLP